jgi:hypothetical protein
VVEIESVERLAAIFEKQLKRPCGSPTARPGC